MVGMIKRFGFSIFLTVAGLMASFYYFGIAGLFTCAILIAIEMAFSFDNAVVNAKILERLSHFWRQLFLTVGMVVAIVGMRFVFPIIIVMITAGLGWHEVLDSALNHPEQYAEYLEEAHPMISAFGGSFLMALSLYFFFDVAREELWLKRIEGPLQKVKGAAWMPAILTTLLVVVISRFVDHSETVLKAGLLGAITYVAMKGVIDGLGKLAPSDQKIYSGWAAFLAFMYLQLLDASFSFDGVLGAFAITDKIILIAIGLGVGAIWVRSMTIYLVDHGILNNYKYLEHGAHYAILILAAALFISLFHEVPDVVTGITGIGVIVASFIASREARAVKKAS